MTSARDGRWARQDECISDDDVSVANLTGGADYHFRFVATNPSERIRADVTFMTSGLPAAVTGAATAVSTSGATLTGS